jgi:hypothetical protein
MSDLAPFVAAALRDRVVMEMQEELNREKETNADLRSVQIVSIGSNSNENDDGDDDDDDDDANNSTVVCYARGPILNGSYEDPRRGILGPLLWNVKMMQDGRTPLPLNLEAIQTFKIRMGGGFFEKSLFGKYADPHVAPNFYDSSSRTGHFELSTYGCDSRVNNMGHLGLCVHPIESSDEYVSVVGEQPGGLYSRLLGWVTQHQQQQHHPTDVTQQGIMTRSKTKAAAKQRKPVRNEAVQVWIDSVSLDVGKMQNIFHTLRVPSPNPPPRANTDPHDLFQLLQLRQALAVRQARMQAFMAQLLRQMEATLVRAQQNGDQEQDAHLRALVARLQQMQQRLGGEP